MRHRRPTGPLAVFISLLFVLAGTSMLHAQASRVLAVVAAENFYGNIVQQIGGDLVNVTSVMSDPNVDPHEYESNVEDAKAIADADLVDREQRRLRRLDGQASLRFSPGIARRAEGLRPGGEEAAR